jgi:putative endonuclease
MQLGHNYYVYVTTNKSKRVLYIGVTNDLKSRIQQHFLNRGKPTSFAGKYYCYNLIYYERFQFVEHAIEREKQLKGWRRSKKEKLIDSFNPTWNFLNEELVNF